jgi:hypothetical protein
VALIAFFQWRTHKAQVKNELFDKRYAMFAAAKTFIQTFLQHGKLIDQYYQESLSKTKGANFIFSDDISNVVKEIGNKAWKHKCNLDLSQTRLRTDQTWEKLTQANIEIFNWFKNTINTIDKTFEKDLKLKIN